MNIQMSISSIIYKYYIKMKISSAGVWTLLCNLIPHAACRADNSKRIKWTSCTNFNINFFSSKSLESEEIHKDWKHANVVQTYTEGEKYEAVN